MLNDLPCIAIRLFTFFFLMRLVLSFFPIREGSIGDSVRGAAFLLTEPVLSPIRQRVPPLPGALAGFGVAEIILLIVLTVLEALVCR